MQGCAVRSLKSWTACGRLSQSSSNAAAIRCGSNAPLAAVAPSADGVPAAAAYIHLRVLLKSGPTLELQLLPEQCIYSAVNAQLEALGPLRLDLGSRSWLSLGHKPLRPGQTPLRLGLVAGPRQRRREAVVLHLHGQGLVGGIPRGEVRAAVVAVAVERLVRTLC